jgi:hypothetical protein
MKRKSSKRQIKKPVERSTKEVILSFKGAPPIEGEKSFYTSINKAIALGENVDALKDIVKEFEVYKAYMSNVFVKDEPAYEKIFKFHVEYLLKKPVWREFEMEGRGGLALSLPVFKSYLQQSRFQLRTTTRTKIYSQL